MRTALVLSLLISTAALGGPPEGGCAHLPPTWRLAELQKSIFPEVDGVLSLLAWKIDEDERPLRVERAVVLMQLRRGGSTLASVYRHPKDKQPLWRLAMVYDVPYTGARSYAGLPSHAELEQFLLDSWWHFDAEKRWRVIGSEVCAATWRTAFGTPPWHNFGEPPTPGAH